VRAPANLSGITISADILTVPQERAHDIPGSIDTNISRGNPMKRITVVLAALVGLFVLTNSAEASVLRVVVVETNDVAAYMGQLNTLRASLQRLGSKSTVRAWRARFAGPNAGSIVVAVEYADMASFAAEDSMIAKDAEYQATLKSMSQVRKIVSDSLYEELK
jgi:hypothetical protein